MFRERVLWAKSVVFGDGEDGSAKGKKKKRGRKLILLSAAVLDRFSLAKMPPPASDGNSPRLHPTRTCHYWRWWIVGHT